METVPEEIHREIRPGERVVWLGQPVQGVLSTWWDPLFIPLKIVIFVAMLFTAYLIFTSTHLDKVFGLVLLFFCYGSALSLYRKFICYPRNRTKIFYAITNSRLLSISPRQTVSVPLKGLIDVELVRYNTNTGRISFGRRSVNSDGLILTNPPYFDMVDDVTTVFTLILQAIKIHANEHPPYSTSKF